VTHTFHPEAAKEFAEAVEYYQQHGQVLADRFQNEIRYAFVESLNTPNGGDQSG
jgi:hypothetical protein